MDLSLSATDVTVSGVGYKSLSVSLSGADVGDILGQIDIKHIIDYYPVKELLDEIGEDDAKNHFGLYNEDDIGNFNSEFEDA